MSLSFLTPAAALVGLAVIPALLVRRGMRRRSAAAVVTLGLQARSRRHAAVDSGLLVAIAVVVAASAAQPVVSATAATSGRESSEAIVVVDVTRSMLARRSPTEPTRLDRARRLAKELRVAVPDVRFGLASLTDRVLPHLFPTLSENAFAAAIDRAVGIERPPPDRRARRATALAALGGLGRAAFFDESTTKRLAVVVTDGETIPADLGALRSRLEQGRVTTMFVHVWRHDEAIFDGRGAADSAYRPDPTAARGLARIAGATDARVFSELEGRELAAELRRRTRDDALVGQTRELHARELAPYLAAFAGLPLFLLLWRRNA